MPTTISLASAVTLTNLSKRTLWRRISDGSLSRCDDNLMSDKAKVNLESIQPLLVVSLRDEELALLEPADNGDVGAQTELAIIFLSQEQPDNAAYWLKLAAKKNSNAMYLLGRCYVDGIGIEQNDDLGLMWIAKAAANGCFFAQVQMQAIKSKICRHDTPII